ncbi:methylase [Alsobacter metallidurans]|uniref:site-specific DNA-methyltransferase (adenine-specific) n=1 Tax=Alsobacter metallidurans TaxID=340221 RepID=A0A917MI31_9HYPH|nr:class I SAM-dependent DNA methyltransferase [Alsobacter metallidurans]GGH08363.1 methylase [Alsobacter metallidurans]
MRLDWNDIRARAAHFAREWSDAAYEKGETQSFYNDFFEVFGVPRRRVASFERAVKPRPGERGFIDLFWPGKLLVEQKSAGRDLRPARKQALDYFPGLRDDELPRYVLLSDFQTFELFDLDTRPDEPIRFRLPDLPDRVQDFGFIVGQEKRVFKDQDPVNIVASEVMGALHDALEASGYTGHALERFLVRIVFCLFADDTGIFNPLGAFEDYIVHRTSEDGSDLGLRLSHLFEVLNTPADQRQTTLDADLAQFDYINGDLFAERLPLPAFDRAMREKLLYACGFNWQNISPAIFGSLFQSVMNKAERRKKGAHYTSEKNILKVIQPLFLDHLRAEFSRIRARLDNGRRRALQEFHDRLGALTFLDPACGCGNFLVIAYRELRLLEIEVMRELLPAAQLVTDIGLYTRINVNQFYGIEIGEFPARIAEVAMWMMDHIMNARLSAEFGKSYLRIPLRASPNILHGDALEADWASLLPPERCSYVLGNPPFIGAKNQSEQQRAQMIGIASLGKTGGTLDYVCAWFIKAGAYIRASAEAAPRIGFVATNSITQGEQVAQLWPILFQRYGLEIAFAHRTFQWLSDAKGAAHVHCVILGLVRREDEPKEKRLFSYEEINGDPVETRHSALTAYLTDACNLSSRYIVVHEVPRPLCPSKTMITGSKPLDGGYLTFTDDEKNEGCLRTPQLSQFLRPYLGAAEYINGRMRWILCLQAEPPHVFRLLKLISERLTQVSEFRRGKRGARNSEKAGTARNAGTVKLATTPVLFHVNVLPSAPFLVIPQTSSEFRDYIPIGWLAPPSIPSDKLRIILDADLWDFGILTSQMHMAWTRTITGRMKSDYMYSVGVVYNTFPWPHADVIEMEVIRGLAQRVLDARDAHPGATLADLYDTKTMPLDLRKAHRSLDLAIDRLYRREPFSSDRERVEHLFGLYEKLTANLLTIDAAKTRKKRRAKAAA